MSLIDEIRNHPGRNFLSTGPLAATAAYQKGTPQYDFHQTLEQAKSGAFLSAFSTLRGGGSISDAEGKKATTAFARMDAAQTKAGFDKALDDYRNVIQTGLQNQQRIARGELQPYSTTPIDLRGGGALRQPRQHRRQLLSASAIAKSSEPRTLMVNEPGAATKPDGQSSTVDTSAPGSSNLPLTSCQASMRQQRPACS